MSIGSIGSRAREFRISFLVAVLPNAICILATRDFVRVSKQTFFVAHEVSPTVLLGAVKAALERCSLYN